MDSQQLLDFIVIPTLKGMGGNYDSLDARILLLSTAAIESNCGYYIRQKTNDGYGKAMGIWQMEGNTKLDILENCDAVQHETYLYKFISGLKNDTGLLHKEYLIVCPEYSCAMARLKYSMDLHALPNRHDKDAIYRYYKRIYNTEHGASTAYKFNKAWELNGLDDVNLEGTDANNL